MGCGRRLYHPHTGLGARCPAPALARVGTGTSRAQRNQWLPHGTGPKHEERHCRRFSDESTRRSHADLPPRTATPVTGPACTHQPERGARQSEPGHGGPGCQTASLRPQACGRVLPPVLGLTMVTNSQEGPCQVCQPEGMQGSVVSQLALLNTHCLGSADGLGVERQTEQSRARRVVHASPQGPSPFLSPPHPSLPFHNGIKGLPFPSAFPDTRLSHQHKSCALWVSGCDSSRLQILP